MVLLHKEPIKRKRNRRSTVRKSQIINEKQKISIIESSTEKGKTRALIVRISKIICKKKKGGED